MQHHTHRLGDILVADGAIRRDVLELYAPLIDGRIGEFLRAHGFICGRKLRDALAKQLSLPVADFERKAPDKALFRPHELLEYIQHRYVPYARDTEGTLTIATYDPTSLLVNHFSVRTGAKVRVVVATRRDINHYFVSRAASAATRRARLALRRMHRHLTADRILYRHQSRALALGVIALAAAIFFAPAISWMAILILCNGFYLTTLALKLKLFAHGQIAAVMLKKKDTSLAIKAAAIADHDLPVYSILVPMYRENSIVLVRLIGSLSALDYPREKLDIKLICEADDAATIEALKALRPPAAMEIFLVPPSLPRTKPKACNVALAHVRGEFLVIYDAEDAPAPDQLRRAVAVFREGGETLACLQAPLNYFNRNENLLTQLFAIEYSALFRLMLPALELIKTPIPLGGTSNHLRAASLHAVGGWDAFNVTEDADLGIRLSYLGHHTQILPSLTLEEAPITYRAWLKQRTRWIKGYIQTWLVFTRHPRELKRRLGIRAYYGFQFFVGAPALTFLLAPLFWVVFGLSLFGIFPDDAAHLSPAMLTLCSFSLLGGIISNWLFARSVLVLEGWHDMRRALCIYPFYWILHSLAAARALWQLITAPHYWDKTMHGKTKYS